MVVNRSTPLCINCTISLNLKQLLTQASIPMKNLYDIYISGCTLYKFCCKNKTVYNVVQKCAPSGGGCTRHN